MERQKKREGEINEVEARMQSEIENLKQENNTLKREKEAAMQRHVDDQQQHDDDVVREMLTGPFVNLPTPDATNTFGKMSTMLANNMCWQRVSPEIHRQIMEKARQQEERHNRLLESMAKMTEKPAMDTPKELPAVEPQTRGGERVTFCQRVKDIITKAATKNGQSMQSNAKGHERSYTFWIDAEVFCRAMDTLLREDEKMLTDFLDGNIFCTQVGRVCFFIGKVIEMHLINDAKLQLTDLTFAFEDYYQNTRSVRTKLSVKECTPAQKVLMGVFRGLLNRYKSVNKPKIN